ncbi:MAG TPA: DUF3108 domain-containing protein [Bryobacteraceae bacterium]|nr:DUF3108 domain-containing protein [Bryobacteraceae bacterium]
MTAVRMLLLGFGGALVAATPNALPPKESLDYTIEWRLVTAGKAHLNWSATAHDADPGWEADLQMESVGLVSKLFKVNNSYISNLESDLCSSGSYLKAEEGKRRKETSVTFDHQNHKAEYLEKDLEKGTVVNTHEIEIPACVHDVLGGLYLLRTMNLQPGQSTQVAVSDGKKSVMARVEAQQREDVKTPAGSFKTIRYEAFLFNDVLYRRYGHLYVWLTDDARKLPVQIRVRLQFAIGTITLQLEKEQKT